MGFDGELLEDEDNVRKSYPVHITMTMWVLNMFKEKEKVETLIRSMDFGNIDLKFHDYKHAI